MRQSFRAIRVASRGLRGRVALLCLLTTAPLLILLTVGAFIDFRQAEHLAVTRAFGLARNGGEKQSELIAETKNLLATLPRIDMIRNSVAPACSDLLQSLVRTDPRIDSLAVADPGGAVLCSSRANNGHQSVGDRQFFRGAMAEESGGALQLEMVTSKFNGQPTLVAALPFWEAGSAGARKGVILAALSMDWLSNLAVIGTTRSNTKAMVIDPSNGQVLGRSGDTHRLEIGDYFPDRRLLAAFRRQPDGGHAFAIGPRGRPMIYGYSLLRLGNRPLMLVIGLSRSEVLAGPRGRFRVGAVLAALAVAGALLINWFASFAFVLRPIASLAEAAHRLGEGDLATRALPVGGILELRALELAFNRMAKSLQARTRQLAATQGKLAVSEMHHRVLAESAGDMITRIGSDFRRTYVSPACRDLLGFEPEDLVGATPGAIVHPDDWLMMDATLYAPLKAGHDTARATYRAIRKDGTTVWVESAGRRLSDGKGYVVVTRDVSERKAFEDQLEAANRQLELLASSDPLTGLPNRRRFDEMLASEYRRARRLGLPLAVLVIDADNFKSYNDAYGHPAGDECLRAVAQAVEGALRRPSDLAARLGGEEFVALLPNTDCHGAAQMAERVLRAVQNLRIPHARNSGGIVTVSIGAAATIPDGLSEPTMLVSKADIQLYTAKAAGRNAVRVASMA